MKFTLSDEQIISLEKNYQEAMNDEVFKKLVNKLHWSKEEVMKRTSKLQNTCEELLNCKNCKGLFMCKNAYPGYVSMPKKENGKISFFYDACRYTKKMHELKVTRESEEKTNEKARMKDIDVKDKRRIEVIKWLDDFYDKYDYKTNLKGLYLHGSFGCGKTFLVSALLHELEEKKMVSTMVVYFPELIRELKSDWELYDRKINTLLNVDILCIDDIGAEKVTEWSRDEVLGTILQHRMNQNKTTFFTSNLTIDELENHFVSRDEVDSKIKARRIMERIKQLSVDMELISENKRK